MLDKLAELVLRYGIGCLRCVDAYTQVIWYSAEPWLRLADPSNSAAAANMRNFAFIVPSSFSFVLLSLPEKLPRSSRMTIPSSGSNAATAHCPGHWEPVDVHAVRSHRDRRRRIASANFLDCNLRWLANMIFGVQAAAAQLPLR